MKERSSLGFVEVGKFWNWDWSFGMVKERVRDSM